MCGASIELAHAGDIVRCFRVISINIIGVFTKIAEISVYFISVAVDFPI